MKGFEEVEYREIVQKTKKAVRLVFDDGLIEWFPLSQIELYEDESRVNMPLWLYNKKIAKTTPEDITRQAMK